MGKFDKIKYLYVGGDSWSRGDDLPEDETLPDYPGGPMGRPIGRYSDVLGEKFGWEVINESMGGGSNDRTVRKMIDWFAKNKDKWEETKDFLVKSMLDINRQMTRNNLDVKVDKDPF